MSLADCPAREGSRSWSPYAGFPRKAILLDLIERVFIIILFANFAFRMVEGFHLQLETFLIILSEVLPVLLILVRLPSRTLSDDRLDWVFGLAGAAGPLLIFVDHTNNLIPIGSLGYFITTLGVSAQVAAKICLGRSFGAIAANRGVKVSGPYRVVRHPMYAGYIITYIGILLMVPSPVNAFIYLWVASIHTVRILREERVLMCDPAYQEFAARVRYRLLPGIF